MKQSADNKKAHSLSKLLVMRSSLIFQADKSNNERK